MHITRFHLCIFYNINNKTEPLFKEVGEGGGWHIQKHKTTPRLKLNNKGA